MKRTASRLCKAAIFTIYRRVLKARRLGNETTDLNYKTAKEYAKDYQQVNVLFVKTCQSLHCLRFCILNSNFESLKILPLLTPQRSNIMISECLNVNTFLESSYFLFFRRNLGSIVNMFIKAKEIGCSTPTVTSSMISVPK